MVTIFIRTVLIYIILVFSMRLMGKRQVGELQLSELTVTILLSELAAYPLTDKDAPFAYSALCILLLLSIEVIVSFILLRFPSLKVLLTGKPSIIIRDGTLDQKELMRQRLCLSELLCALRQEGVFDIADVKYAILEENGKLSVFPKPEVSPLTPRDAKIKAEDNGIAHSLIIDRKIIRQNLKDAGWTRSRLDKALKARNCRLDDVFLFSVNDAEDITVIYRESGK